MEKTSYTIVFSVLISTMIFIGSSNFSYGHMFTNDESASFMALVDKIKVQGKEIKNHLLNGDTSIASKHLQKIMSLYTDDIDKEIKEKNERISDELGTSFSKLEKQIQDSDSSDIDSTVEELNSILDEALSVRIEADIINNSTVQALHFANIVNAIDINYADIFDDKPMDMSMGMMDDSEHTSMDINDSEHTSMDMNDKKMDVNVTTIINPESLHTVNGLLDVAENIFETKLKTVPEHKEEFIVKAEEGLTKLKEITKQELPYDEAMKIIHGVIHPNIQEAYNLELEQDNNAKSMDHDMMNSNDESHESMNDMNM